MSAVTGAKVYWLLDPCTGKPAAILTRDQAAAAKRKGLPTTWVRRGFALPAGAGR